MSETWVQLTYLVAAVCFILALKGLSSPKFARRGNWLGAFGATLAVVVTLVAEPLDHMPWILLAIAIGTALGVPAARRVAMTAMPQLVALFNGVGGAAAAIVAIVEFAASGQDESLGILAASSFTVVVGSVSFSGSVVTFLKLQGLMTSRPVVFSGMQLLLPATAIAAVALGVAVLPTRSMALDLDSCWSLAAPGRAVRTPRRGSGRSDRHFAPQRIHGLDCRGVRIRSRQRPAPRCGNSGRGKRHSADPAHGAGHGSTTHRNAVWRVRRLFHIGWWCSFRPPREVARPSRCRRHAEVCREGGHCSRVRPRRRASSGDAEGAR